MKKILRAISTMLALGVVAISFLGCRKTTGEYKEVIYESEAFPTGF